MPYPTLTLNGNPVDLPADAAVALSYRANDLRNLDSRESTFSETFTLPLTAQNVAVLGAPHSLDSLTTTPYRLLPAVLTSPGGVVLLNGFAILESSGEGYDITLISAIGGLFTQVGDRNLRDLDLSEYDHTLNFTNTQAAENNIYTEGYACVLDDDGRQTRRDAGQGILYYEARLAVFYHTVLKAIVREALPNWYISGSLLAEDTYQRAVLPQATAYPQVPPAILANSQASASNQDGLLYSGLGPRGQFLTAVIFPIENDPGGNLFAGTYFTTPRYHADITIKVRLRTRVRRVPGSNITAVVGNALIRDASQEQQPVIGVGQASVGKAGVFSSTQYFSHTVNDTFSPPAYTEFTVNLERMEPGTVLALLMPLFVNVETMILPGSSISWQVGPRAYPGSPRGLAGSLPDISQADFLKLVFNQFNLIVQPDEVTKRLRFDLFNDLERNRNRAVDWTDKLDFTQRPRLAYRLGEYAQLNTLAYDSPPSVYEQLGSLPPIPLGSGDLPVVNATLPKQAEAYTAPVFLPQLNAALGGPFAFAWLPFFARPDDFKSEPERWDPNKTYGDTEQLVIYGDVIWKGRALVSGTVPGSSRAVQDGVWQPQEYEILNEELSSTALLSPVGVASLLEVVVRDDAPSNSTYNCTRRFVREGFDFTALLAAYYPGLTNILQRVQLLTLDVRLNALDIANLDFTKPVKVTVAHIPGYGKLKCLCYVNSIDQYQPGFSGAVEVTLLVLGLPVPGLAPPVGFPMPSTTQAFATENGLYFLLSEQGYFFLEE